MDLWDLLYGITCCRGDIRTLWAGIIRNWIMTEISDVNEYEHRFLRCNIREALDIALDCRKFEIELYWKRANYFVIIIGAIFIGYYTVKSDLYRQILSCLGYAVSFGWICLNRGSKFWQENWESNIKYLCEINGTPIFNLVRYGERKPYLLMKSYPYSVSRLNLLVSIGVWLCWLLLIIIGICYSWNLDHSCHWKLMFGAKICVVVLSPILIHYYGRGFMARSESHDAKMTKDIVIVTNN